MNEQLSKIESQLRELLDRNGPPQRWLTVQQAANYAGLSAVSIRRLIDAGQLQAHRPTRGRILLDVRQIDAVIQSATQRPRSGRGFNVRQQS